MEVQQVPIQLLLVAILEVLVYGVVLGANVAVGAFCNASGDTTPFSGGGGAIAIGFTVDASNKEAIAMG